MLKKWEQLRSREVFNKYSRRIEEVIFRLPNGDEVDFYIKNEGKIVTIVGFTEDSQVIIARQYRPGLDEILMELPGGAVDEGEEPLEAAKREFLEETGYSGEFEFVGDMYRDAYSTLVEYCYVAKNCKEVAKPKILPTEEIEVVLLGLPEFRALLRSGKQTNVEAGYTALDYLGLL